MSKVSIIVPVFNTEKYLKKCLDSLINQTLDDIDVIIVNDGSTDNSEKIINEYLEKYNDKITYIYQTNSGQAKARNKALKYAKGEYISFVDSDDFVDLNMYEIMYNKAKDNDLDIVICGFNMVYEDGRVLERSNYKELCDDNIINYILSIPGPCAKIYKRKIWQENNIKFPEGIIYEDLAIVPCIGAYASKVENIDMPLYNYLQREASTMNFNRYNKKMEDIFPALENMKNEFIRSNTYTKYKEEIEYIYIMHLLHSASLRFLKFDEGMKFIDRIIQIMKSDYPNFRNNRYYKNYNFKYKILCELVIRKKTKLLSMLVKKRKKT